MTTTGTTRTTTAPRNAEPLVQPGTLADVTAAERLVEPPVRAGLSEGEGHGLARLALAHLALTSGGLWVVREDGGGLVTAAAVLPPGEHPDVAGLAWMAHVQLGLAVPALPGAGAAGPRLLLPPRRAALAREVVRAALRGVTGRVVALRPGDPAVTAVLAAEGFLQHPAPGLLQRPA